MTGVMRFRAKAVGGITPAEATRRERAVMLARQPEAPATKFPEPMPHFGGAVRPEIPEREAVDETGFRLSDGSVSVDALARVRAPEAPVVTLTIAVARPGSGRRVVAHLIRRALAHDGIVVEGPEGLRSVDLRRALAHLADRDLHVRLVFEDGAEPEGGT